MPVTDRMPTTARLVAALCLAALGWVASEMIRDIMPPHTGFGWFNVVNVVLGALCGWYVIGTRVGRGYVDAVSIGLTGAVALVVWGLFAQSLNEMLRQALMKKYEGPVEAIVGIFNNAMEFGQFLLDAPLIITLILGGIAAGLLSEFAARRWT